MVIMPRRQSLLAGGSCGQVWSQRNNATLSGTTEEIHVRGVGFDLGVGEMSPPLFGTERSLETQPKYLPLIFALRVGGGSPTKITGRFLVGGVHTTSSWWRAQCSRTH